ncbi:hypothetical protein [Porphyromonas pogonae]|uniref:HU domain-containing protein n=1 Tax=Porphyromonas pogonae TaxID=867595 RepID=UPI002E770905|nr:hypothetical protein [Porphyromonas pogonae]
MNSRIVSHIKRNILLHQCVVVPGLGGFVMQTIPAYFNREEHLAYPPKEQIHFNEFLNHRDGLLEESYARVYAVSLRRARVMLEEDIKILRQELISERIVDLGGIGKLSLSEGGKLSFSNTVKEDRFAGCAYGLIPVSLPIRIEERAAMQSETSHNQKEAIHAESTPTELIPSTGIPQISMHKEGYVYIPKKVIHIAAAVILLCLCILPFGSVKETNRNYTASFVPTEITANKLWSNNWKEVFKQSEPATNKSVEISPQDQRFSSSSHDNNIRIITSPTNSKRYYVVIATIKDVKKATSYYQAHVDAAILPHAGMLQSKSINRIFADSFDTAKEAYTYLNQLTKNQPQHSTAWVYLSE